MKHAKSEGRPRGLQASPRLRSLRAADIPACAALVGATPLWQTYGYSAARCARDLATALARGDELHVLVAGAVISGLAWVIPRGGFGRTRYLKLLVVEERSRGRRLGEQLLRSSEARGDLMLLVSDFNHRARRFYARQGYLRVGALPGYVLPGVTEIAMYKQAKAPKPIIPSSRLPARGSAAEPPRESAPEPVRSAHRSRERGPPVR